MLDEKVEIDSIDVRGTDVHVREATVVLKDGNEIAKTYHRYVLHKGDDLSKQPKKVADIAKVVWVA